MKQYIIIISTAFALSSCSDFLELNPKTEISEQEYFQTETDIFKALTGVYDRLQAGYDDGSHNYVSLCADILSDDLNAGGGDATDIAILQGLDSYTVSSITNPNGLWRSNYRGINRANTIIEKIPQAKGSAEVLARYKAEAHLLRDFFYYWLWQYYGNVVILEANISDPAEYYTQSQSTPEEVYNFLIRDLDENVIGKLPVNVSGEEAGRLTDAAAIALKAKIVLFQNDEAKYPDVIRELKKVISSGEYALESDYEKIWLQEGEHCRESVFEIEFSTDNGTMMCQLIFPRGFTDPTGVFVEGWGFATMNKDLVDLYDADDIRKSATVFAIDDSIKAHAGDEKNYSYTPAYQNTGYFLKKYAPRTGYYGSNRFYFKNNVRVFRYSDILLMVAEMSLRTGNQGEAQNCFAEVWNRAHTASAAPAVTLDLLYKERRLEFAGEGYRYWDLIRTGKAAEVLGGKGWTARNRYLPVPDAEITKSQGSLKQNEGY